MSSYMLWIMPEKELIPGSYEASEGLRTLQIHVLFYGLSFYFVIVQVAVI